MIIDVYAVTSRRNKRPRAVTSFHCGLQIADCGLRIADSGRPLRGRSDKVYHKVGNFGGGYTPQGPVPATLLQSLQTLTLLGVLGATNPLQGATSRYNLRHF